METQEEQSCRVPGQRGRDIKGKAALSPGPVASMQSTYEEDLFGAPPLSDTESEGDAEQQQEKHGNAMGAAVESAVPLIQRQRIGAPQPPWKQRTADERQAWGNEDNVAIQFVLDKALECIESGRKALDEDGCLRELVSSVRDELRARFPDVPETLLTDDGLTAINPPAQPEDALDQRRCLDQGRYSCPLPLCQRPFESAKKLRKHLGLCKNKGGGNRLQKKKFSWVKFYRDDTVIYRSLKYLARRQKAALAHVKQGSRRPLYISVPADRLGAVLKALGVKSDEMEEGEGEPGADGRQCDDAGPEPTAV